MIVRSEGPDCEELDTWLLDQDVNAWTSLSYVVAGALVIVLAGRRRLPHVHVVLGIVVVVEGVGSVLDHGGSGDVARFVHDVALVAVLGFIAGWQVGRLRASPGAGALAGTWSAVVVGSAVWVLAPSSTNTMVAVGLATVAVAELLARRRHLPVIWDRTLVTVLAVAAFAWWLGRPASPLCDPGSLFQLHGLWHLLTALVVVGWADRSCRSVR